MQVIVHFIALGDGGCAVKSSLLASLSSNAVRCSYFCSTLYREGPTNIDKNSHMNKMYPFSGSAKCLRNVREFLYTGVIEGMGRWLSMLPRHFLRVFSSITKRCCFPPCKEREWTSMCCILQAQKCVLNLQEPTFQHLSLCISCEKWWNTCMTCNMKLEDVNNVLRVV